MFALRRILMDIYEYQVNTPGVNIHALEEEGIIKYLQVKYDVSSYNKVKTKIDELRKEKLITDTGIPRPIADSSLILASQLEGVTRLMFLKFFITSLCILNDLFIKKFQGFFTCGQEVQLIL